MRDGWTRGLGLPKPDQKLFKMLEREADWRRPDRMRDQALAVMRGVCHRELAPAFRSTMQQMKSAPTPIELLSLQSWASTSPLGSEMVRRMLNDTGVSSQEALYSALFNRSILLVSELKRCYAMERAPLDGEALASFISALRDAVAIVAQEQSSGVFKIVQPKKPSLGENLL